LISCHDCADGGLFITLLESSFQNKLGFEVISDITIRKDAFLFGETQGRIIVSVSIVNILDFEKLLSDSKTPYFKLGIVKGSEVIIDSENYGSIAQYQELFNTAIENKLK
jgi:phosphoribosylformylglycinamidine synthase